MLKRSKAVFFALLVMFGVFLAAPVKVLAATNIAHKAPWCCEADGSVKQAWLFAGQQLCFGSCND